MASIMLNGSSQPETLITSAGGAVCEHQLKKRKCSRFHNGFTKSSPANDTKVRSRRQDNPL